MLNQYESISLKLEVIIRRTWYRTKQNVYIHIQKLRLNQITYIVDEIRSSDPLAFQLKEALVQKRSKIRIQAVTF